MGDWGIEELRNWGISPRKCEFRCSLHGDLICIHYWRGFANLPNRAVPSTRSVHLNWYSRIILVVRYYEHDYEHEHDLTVGRFPSLALSGIIRPSLAHGQRMQAANVIVRLWPILVLLLCQCAVWAFSPLDALAYRSQETLLTRDKLAILRESARMARLGTTGTLSSTLQEASKESYSLTANYARNPVTIAEHDRAVSDTERNFQSLSRGDIVAALQAHAALWQAQATLAAAEERASLYALLLKESERKQALGAISAMDYELARIDADDAALSVRKARQTLTVAQADAARLALAGDAESTTLTFALPAADVERAPSFQTALWDRKTARARQIKARQDLTPALVPGALHTGNVQIDASISSRDLSTSAQIGYPTLNDPFYLLYQQGWTFTLRLDVPIDPLGWSTAREARADVRMADAEMATRREELVVQIPKARDAVNAANAQLALARDRQKLQQRKLEIMKIKAAAGSASATDLLNAQAACHDAETQVAVAWSGYIQATAAYLDLVDGTWEIEKQK